jgi:AbrB family looped-hinge helix DNA binding protein
VTRVTSKGQVTIPKHVRDKLGIGPGSEVGFREEGGQIILAPEPDADAKAAAENMIRHMQEFGRKAKRIPMTDKELMALTRDLPDERDTG